MHRKPTHSVLALLSKCSTSASTIFYVVFFGHRTTQHKSDSVTFLCSCRGVEHTAITTGWCAFRNNTQRNTQRRPIWSQIWCCQPAWTKLAITVHMSYPHTAKSSTTCGRLASYANGHNVIIDTWASSRQVTTRGGTFSPRIEPTRTQTANV